MQILCDFYNLWHDYDPPPQSIRYPSIKTCFTNIHPLQFITIPTNYFRWTSALSIIDFPKIREGRVTIFLLVYMSAFFNAFTLGSFFMIFAPQITRCRMMHLWIRNYRKSKLDLYLIVSYWVHWIMFIQGLVIWYLLYYFAIPLLRLLSGSVSYSLLLRYPIFIKFLDILSL